MRADNGLFVWALLVAAVIVSSTSVIMIKASGADPNLLASIRLLGAAAVLSPLYVREYRSRRAAGLAPASHGAAFRVAVVPGVIIAVHFISWIVGARLTTAGNSTLIVNMNPVAMPLAAFFLSGVRPTRRELLATAIATGGIFLMGVGDFSLSPDYFVGDAVCFLSMLCFTAYLAFSRRNNADGRLWTYIVPLYAVGGALAFAAAAATPGALSSMEGADVLLALGLVLGPTVLGHSALNWAMTVLRPQTVTIVNLFQFVSAGILAFFFFGEMPGWTFYATTVLILAGALLSVLGRKNAAA
jgi:drug/metabolite transporter (DMT)-like permease